jgi:hypothetical protein
VDAQEQPVEAAREHDAAGEREIAPGGQFDELKDSGVEAAIAP